MAWKRREESQKLCKTAFLIEREDKIGIKVSNFLSGNFVLDRKIYSILFSSDFSRVFSINLKEMSKFWNIFKDFS